MEIFHMTDSYENKVINTAEHNIKIKLISGEDEDGKYFRIFERKTLNIKTGKTTTDSLTPDEYDNLLERIENKPNNISVEDQCRNLIFRTMTNRFLNKYNPEQLIEIRKKLFNNDESVFKDITPEHSSIIYTLPEISTDQMIYYTQNKPKEFVLETIKKHSFVEDFKSSAQLPFILAEKFGLVDEYIQIVCDRNIKSIYIPEIDDLAKIKDLGIVIFNADNGIIATNGIDILLFPEGKLIKQNDEFWFKRLPDIDFIELGSEDAINVNGQTYKAKIENLKMIEIINYEYENFEFFGDLDKLKSKTNKPEPQKIQKLKP